MTFLAQTVKTEHRERDAVGVEAHGEWGGAFLPKRGAPIRSLGSVVRSLSGVRKRFHIPVSESEAEKSKEANDKNRF